MLLLDGILETLGEFPVMCLAKTLILLGTPSPSTAILPLTLVSVTTAR
jgi:hypothetical protein